MTITGLEYFILNKFFPEFLNLSAISTKGTEEFSNKLLEVIQEYQSIVLMSFIPVYALMCKIVFFNIKKFNYLEHLVIFMYITSQMTIIGTVIVLTGATLNSSMGEIIFFAIILQILYSAYCLKRLYELSSKGIILRTLFLFLVLLVFYITSIILSFVILFLTEGSEVFEALIKTQKAANN